MKCIYHQQADEYKRVTDTEAPQYLRYGWRYISKAAYKAAQVAKLVDNRRLPMSVQLRKEARRV